MNLVRKLAHHQLKPDPDVLLEICHTEGVQTYDAAYVGDSIARDMLMAKRAGVFAIWAENMALTTTVVCMRTSCGLHTGRRLKSSAK